MRVTNPRSVSRAMCSCKSEGAFCVVAISIADLRYQQATRCLFDRDFTQKVAT
jgi:hypothetical protein